MQALSIHEFRERDWVVRDGVSGRITDARALYADVRWEGGEGEEIEQLDPTVFVELRAQGEPHG